MPCLRRSARFTTATPGGTSRHVPPARGPRFPEQSPADGPSDPGVWQGSASLRTQWRSGSGCVLADDRAGSAGEPASPELAELAPLLALTLGEQQDASMAGLVKMLEKPLRSPPAPRPSAVPGVCPHLSGDNRRDREVLVRAHDQSAADVPGISSPNQRSRAAGRGFALLRITFRPARLGRSSSSLVWPLAAAIRTGPVRTSVIKIHTLLDGVRTLADLAQSAAWNSARPWRLYEAWNELVLSNVGQFPVPLHPRHGR